MLIRWRADWGVFGLKQAISSLPAMAFRGFRVVEMKQFLEPSSLSWALRLQIIGPR